MKNEIEAKLKVDSLEQIVERLDALGAQYKCEFTQRDTYFDADEDVLVKTDRGLRLRQEKTSDTEKIFLTYKGPKQKTQFKSRQEIEVQISDFTNMAELLTVLGFRKRISFEKNRRLWLLDDCQICLDELPLLGCFIEIEGPDEQTITGVLEKLGLSKLDHIGKTYSRLIADKLRELGSDKTDVFFNTDFT